MKKLRRDEEQAEVPMSAMIDVVFLLLIFFAATYVPQRTEAHVSVNGPGTGPQGSPPMFVAHVLPGRYLFMQRPTTLDDLTAHLSRYLADDPDLKLVVKIDPGASNQEYVTLLDRCKKAGIKDFHSFMLKGQ